MANEERLAIFIDGSNFYHALKDCHNKASIDFQKLAEALSREYKLLRVYYYNAPVNAEQNPDGHKSQQRFFDRLRKIPLFEVKLGYLVERRAGPVEKGVDVQLAVDLVSMGLKDRYDVAILISGDADFAPAVQIVKDEGKHVFLAYPKISKAAKKLQQTCDGVIELNIKEHVKFLS